MKRLWTSILAGCLAGLFAAATVALAAFLLLFGMGGLPPLRDVAAQILWRVLWTAGPGALLLGAALAWFLRRGVEAGRPRGATLGIGALAGALLAIPVLVSALWLSGDRPQIAMLLDLGSSSTRLNLCAALAGGAVHGLASAWWISRPPREAR